MSSQRITITLPEAVAEEVRRRASETGQPVSQVIAAALGSEERRRVREELAEQYKAALRDDETRNVSRDLQALDAADWPEE